MSRVCDFDNCGNIYATSRCGGCGCAVYCNRKCQKKAWKGHKEVCKLFQSDPDRVATIIKQRKLLHDMLSKNIDFITKGTQERIMSGRKGGLFTNMTDASDPTVNFMLWWDFDEMEKQKFTSLENITSMRKAFSQGRWIYGFSYDRKMLIKVHFTRNKIQ